MSRDDGGPAFARSGHEGDSTVSRPQNGMSLHDALAIGALPAAMTTPWSDIGYKPESGLTDIQQHARLAYQMADAMLKERTK